MRKVKGTEDFMMSVIILIIITIIVVWAFYVYIYSEIAGGVTRGLEADAFCVKEKEVSGFFDEKLLIDFNQIYYAKGLAIYITPGGSNLLSLHAKKIYASVFDESNDETPLGYVGEIEDSDLGREMPCIVTGSLGTEKKNKCRHYEGTVTKVEAAAEQKPWCMVSAAIAYVAIVHVIDFFTEVDWISACAVDRLRVQIFYPCSDESTLVEGDCDGDDVEEVGWNHQLPIVCEPAAAAHPCTIEKGTYAVDDIDIIRQVNFPGVPLVQVGVRAGCAGIQSGCNIGVLFGRPVEDDVDPEGCEDPAVVWDQVATFTNLDYEYIYSNPISVSDYIEIDQDSTYYRRWCLRVIAPAGCEINSVDIQKYTK